MPYLEEPAAVVPIALTVNTAALSKRPQETTDAQAAEDVFKRTMLEKMDLLTNEVCLLREEVGVMRIQLQFGLSAQMDKIHWPEAANSIEELADLESSIIEESRRNPFSLYISTIGGNGPAEIVLRIMSQIISNQSALQVNIKGHKGKHSLHIYKQITLALYEAVRSHFPTATDKEVDHMAAKWLSSARDRISK